jgi:hypothetical protein
MTTLNLHQNTTHKLAAKQLRYAGYKAICVVNKEMAHQPYEVKVNASNKECKELQIMLSKMLKNDILNVISTL